MKNRELCNGRNQSEGILPQQKILSPDDCLRLDSHSGSRRVFCFILLFPFSHGPIILMSFIADSLCRFFAGDNCLPSLCWPAKSRFSRSFTTPKISADRFFSASIKFYSEKSRGESTKRMHVLDVAKLRFVQNSTRLPGSRSSCAANWLISNLNVSLIWLGLEQPHCPWASRLN